MGAFRFCCRLHVCSVYMFGLQLMTIRNQPKNLSFGPINCPKLGKPSQSHSNGFMCLWGLTCLCLPRKTISHQRIDEFPFSRVPAFQAFLTEKLSSRGAVFGKCLLSAWFRCESSYSSVEFCLRGPAGEFLLSVESVQELVESSDGASTGRCCSSQGLVLAMVPGHDLKASRFLPETFPSQRFHWVQPPGNFCQQSEGKLMKGTGVVANPGGAGGCEKGGKCVFKFSKCNKCGRREY